MSTVYRPQANGAVERLSRSLGEMSAKIVRASDRQWQNHMFEVQFAHNTAYHESIKDVPSKIVFKDTPRTAIHAAADLVISESENSLESR